MRGEIGDMAARMGFVVGVIFSLFLLLDLVQWYSYIWIMDDVCITVYILWMYIDAYRCGEEKGHKRLNC